MVKTDVQAGVLGYATTPRENHPAFQSFESAGDDALCPADILSHFNAWLFFGKLEGETVSSSKPTGRLLPFLKRPGRERGQNGSLQVVATAKALATLLRFTIDRNLAANYVGASQ